ncbi:MAG TPA: hybrid sensor histidine kinase/response regulator, partial [Planctomycetota bacterium]|nr:hybrid sensor histidine kinase/response regulator [Planctomycetota bacterium]
LSLAAALGLPALGFGVFYGYRTDIATSVTYPIMYGVAAVVHAVQYRRGRGFASAFLAACSAAQGVMCALYFSTIAIGNPAIMILGYAHYASVSIIGVLFGWVHLPRELRGRSPVRMSVRDARTFAGAFLAAEIPVWLGLLVFYRPTPTLFLAGAAVQQIVAFAFYFVHRHQLVIHTDNIGELLEERTRELRAAQGELARQNEILAEKLAEQERDLRAKTQVIDRQRRLELAAQTAGQVAHDIQNLVSPILVRLEELETGRVGADLAGICAVIRRQVEQLMSLNTQLLALSRRGRDERQAVLLADVARDVADRFPGQNLSVASEGTSWIQGSASQISRGISNLVTNAFESDLDRRVSVSLRTGTRVLDANRRCHLGFLSPGRYSFVSVEDTGPGIQDKYLDHIFEPFYSSKGGRHRSGSGLGLTIVAAVVDDHRGVLDLETGPQGTHFTLYFPAIEPPRGDEIAENLSRNATVLVVDDDTSTLRGCREVLAAKGYTVLSAGDGREALRVLQTQPVDLLLLDLGLPHLNGEEVLMGAMHIRPGIRSVIHTSYLTGDQEAALKAIGASAILLKPATPTDLLRALSRAFDERVLSEKRSASRLD